MYVLYIFTMYDYTNWLFYFAKYIELTNIGDLNHGSLE